MVEKIGKYSVIRKIGSGTMGSVYEAVDPIIQRKVAIKTLKSDVVEDSDGGASIKRFQQEAQAIGQLSHKNIVAIYEYGEDDDKSFIAMSYAQGKNLKKYFDKDRRFPLNVACHIMEQLLDALSTSHKLNIYHRDIKPSNIIVQEDGSIMVTDFGIASLESSELTQVGTIMGTPSYMSPEQLMGHAVDGKTDLFSAGVILYQFLTGEKPFIGSTVPSILHKIVHVDPVPPCAINMTLPKIFDGIISKSLAKDKEERYATADEFLADINLAKAALDEKTGKTSSNPMSAPEKRNLSNRDPASPQTRSMVSDETTILSLGTKLEDVDSNIVLPSGGRPELDEDSTTVLPSGNRAHPALGPIPASSDGFADIHHDATIVLSPTLKPSIGKKQVPPSSSFKEQIPVTKQLKLIDKLQEYINVLLQPKQFVKKKTAIPILAFLGIFFLSALVFSFIRNRDEGAVVTVENTLETELSTPDVEINIQSNPTGAKIFMDDNELLGTTDLNTRIVEAKHTIYVRKDGYHDVIVVVQAIEGKPIYLSLNLHPK